MSGVPGHTRHGYTGDAAAEDSHMLLKKWYTDLEERDAEEHAS
jgi:hypothetical protein